ncbi:hypothetical protein LOK49_LG10G01783 [Camellia lanceoleosa]|uniref:Uncharacterized protein n=1 Tax=Camellia lanceoleosa TaxID=1840588 RepID=A0ACC0GEC2_9ERIC|nr:hypothetical protein LOK49_LG10G01783 [Camellia lanceoleosa]
MEARRNASLTLIPSNLLTNSKSFSTMRERKGKSLDPSPPKPVFFALRFERLKFGQQQDPKVPSIVLTVIAECTKQEATSNAQ